MRWGYFDSAEARTNKMLFATDEDTMRYGDVRTFDYGPEPVVSAYTETAQIIDLLPNNVIERSSPRARRRIRTTAFRWNWSI